MVRVLLGNKGSGKTKKLIELINAAVLTEHGNVVCIEWDRELTYDIHYHIRLVEASDYFIPTFDCLKSFISGLYAGNYDITHIFLDNLTKIIRNKDIHEIETFLDWLDAFGVQNNLKFTVTISMPEDEVSEGVRKFR